MADAYHRIDQVMDATNRRFERVRHPRSDRHDDGHQPCHGAARASAASVAYISAFWPHVIEVVAADPDRLGLSVELEMAGERRMLHADDLRASFIADAPADADPTQTTRLATILSSLAMMNRVLGLATSAWHSDFTGPAPRCPLAFALPANDYVSLRMLLARRGPDDNPVESNGATLVMGGTATALTMCWNLLHQIPRAWRQAFGCEPTRGQVEQVWADTRELIFRIGAGSLSAFVAFASACSSKSSAMLWDGADDLGLVADEGHYLWTLNDALRDRYEQMLERIADDQQGQYVGCAALYARAAALPLNPTFADPIDATREPIVFAELIRWIAAVVRRQYLPLFATHAGA